MIKLKVQGSIECCFEIFLECQNCLIIKDLAGPNLPYRSVTNSAEEVIDYFWKSGKLIQPNTKRTERLLYYIDSDNRMDQLDHVNGKFLGFKLS